MAKYLYGAAVQGIPFRGAKDDRSLRPRKQHQLRSTAQGDGRTDEQGYWRSQGK